MLQADEACMNVLKSLSDLHNETMSMINNQLAIEALEAGDVQLGIETLQSSVKDNRNAAALYNLGICYERGIGVEEDRAKVNHFSFKSKKNFSSRLVIITDKQHS